MNIAKILYLYMLLQLFVDCLIIPHRILVVSFLGAGNSRILIYSMFKGQMNQNFDFSLFLPNLLIKSQINIF